MRHVRFIGGPADGTSDDFQSDKAVGDKINVRVPVLRHGPDAGGLTEAVIYEVTRPGVAEPVN